MILIKHFRSYIHNFGELETWHNTNVRIYILKVIAEQILNVRKTKYVGAYLSI